MALRDIEDILGDIGDRFTVIIRDELRKYPSLNQSRILNDPDFITWEVDHFGGDDYELIINLPAYATWVDKGRKPNAAKGPPLKDGQGKFPILEWLKRKGSSDLSVGRQKFVSKRVRIKGIKPRPFLDASLKQWLPRVFDALATGQMSLTKHDLEKLLKKI